ncbi:MAG: helix-turn-helix domain-containing protein [Acidimicrobiales bacterium]
MPRPVEDLTYTLPEAAKALKVGRNAVSTLIANGDLPSLRIGRRVLVSRKALEEWVVANANTRFVVGGEAAPAQPGDSR